MRVVCPILSFLLFFSSSLQVNSQQPIPISAATRDPQALSLLTRCSSAMGASLPNPDFYAVGAITPTNPSNPASTFVLKSKSTNQVRSEITLPSGVQTFVVNNGRGFSLIAGKRNNLALHATAYFRPEHLSAFACSIDLARSSVSVAYVGLESLQAATVHHLLFKSASSNPLEQLISEFHVYLDANTLRVIKTATWVFAPDAIDNRSLWETYYDNYQPVAGILIPMHMEHFLAGTKLDEWTFTSVRTDVPVAEGDFN